MTDHPHNKINEQELITEFKNIIFSNQHVAFLGPNDTSVKMAIALFKTAIKHAKNLYGTGVTKEHIYMHFFSFGNKALEPQSPTATAFHPVTQN